MAISRYHDNSDSASRFNWLDYIRGFAILWIFLVHYVERFLCCPLFANPSGNWPPLSERIAQLAPLPFEGISGAMLNALRYLGWMGDQGVQILLVASGFGLAYSALKRSGNEPYFHFIRRRFAALLPLWIAAHIGLILLSLVFYKGMDPSEVKTWMSLLGLRFLPEIFYYQVASWWFIGVIIQLYLIFPLLLSLLKKWGPVKFFLLVGGVAILCRLAGLFYFEEYLDWWSRGGVFIARLPEFVFGMSFAALLWRRPEWLKKTLTHPLAFLASCLVLLLGNLCSLTLAGMSVAFLFTGASIFVLIYQVCVRWDLNNLGLLGLLGRRSYAIFLVHHPIILFLIPKSIFEEPYGKFFLFLVFALLLSVLFALIFERAVMKIVAWNKYIYDSAGLKRLGVLWGTFVILLCGSVFGGELLVRKFDPMEVLGWGERPALQPHPEFGYNLQENKRTRLRWLDYDYVVEANELGFPGPLYPEEKAADTYRIMVTGDAYASAEGVDTFKAWPRLLETRLKNGIGNTEVMNFSITGWGPNQYASVVKKYLPEYRPDLLIVSFFVNDFEDVALSNEFFQQSIGFSGRKQDSLKSYFELSHLRAWIKKEVYYPLRGTIRNKNCPYGYFFGYFQALERKNLPMLKTNSEKVAVRMESIAQIAAEYNTELLVVLVPAPAQVCRPEHVEYWPVNINLQDSSKFDLEQPQRVAAQILMDLGIRYVDLRETLISHADQLPCQPDNLHWTESGHEAVANFIKDYLNSDHVLHAVLE